MFIRFMMEENCDVICLRQHRELPTINTMHIWSNLMYLSVMFSSENEVCNLTLNLYLHWISRKICLTTANSHENAYIRTKPLPSNA